MHGDLVVLAVLVGVGAFLLLADRTQIPYPILLVAGGTAMAFVPGVSDFVLDPDIILVAFLPPLLYGAAFFTSIQDLRANYKPIGLLAVGLVTATTITVAVVAHYVIDLPWAAAFVLGAVVSPTDPVAATEIAVRSHAPRRLVTIVEGESLINDSTGLIAYKFAVAAVVTGTFSLFDAFGDFVLSAVVGVALGVGIGVVVAAVRKRLDDAPTETAISLLTPYMAYLPAEALGVSAVLSAVSAGLYLGWRSPELVTPSTRIQVTGFWELLTFGLNAALFVLIGLQLRTISEGLDSYSTGELIGYGALVSATVLATRMAWLFPFNIISRLLVRRFPRRASGPAPPDFRVTALLGWSGMRGAVSLAVALAIPLQTDAGAPFPGRDLIIFLAYSVILVTVVGQGLTLGRLIEWAGVYDDDQTVAEQEARARIGASQAAIDRLVELEGEDWVRAETWERMNRQYEYRIRRFESQLDEDDDGDIELGSQAYQRLRRKVLEAERAEIVRARNRGDITDDIMRRIERDLDLEDARLEI
ncbi:putative Na(+)/H(+) exchanger [Baekduia alba]|uniref:Na+/H+ antiporter n=1 Tax=Baekduia alba TaxID=2997333 RepID=UPI0023424417|nr:Na+/H+ antiporter [Baekduia alba]WCB95837.1 putative Na(+)/H(+) exchanger [Baekduia alba]